jgi:hypothetical protein
MKVSTVQARPRTMTAITARAPGTSRDAVTTAKGVTSTAATPSEKRVVVLGGPPSGKF